MIPPLFGKQEVGIWQVKKSFPRYGVPIWSLWPNIRFLPSTVTDKNVMKNILDGRKDRGKTVYPPPPSGSGGIKRLQVSVLPLTIPTQNFSAYPKDVIVIFGQAPFKTLSLVLCNLSGMQILFLKFCLATLSFLRMLAKI